jgi:hypothetical protein
MGIIKFADELKKNNKYAVSTTDANYLWFLSLRFFYKINYSNQITRNIYLGNYIDASNLTFIKDNNIRVIINCSKDIPFYMPQDICPYQYRIPVNDDLQDISIYTMYKYLPKIVSIIHKHISMGENIYIHCHAGMQRSACVVAAYLIHHHKFTVDDAIEYVKNKRSISFFPIANFKKSLEQYEKKIVK